MVQLKSETFFFFYLLINSNSQNLVFMKKKYLILYTTNKTNMYRILLTLVLSIFFSVLARAQRVCGTMENYYHQTEKDPAVKKKYEDALKTIIDNEGQIQRTSGAVITIPVVVHVIHNNEPIGSGTNISDDQVLSQIEALNEDFRLMNADSLSPGHPFWQFQADVSIEFCLARQTPGGQPSTGIERFFGGLDWEMSDCEQVLKPQTFWDPERFLNLWTVDWGGANSDLLGYAQFPGGSANTDGVVIGYQYFGFRGNVSSPYDLGRTGTHEIGHWLGLRHIWGDATCGNDLISDTPIQEMDNSDCPTFPHNAFSVCGSNANGEMFMNYMDYVDDRCMVMFTDGQATRMNSALTIQRSTLITSNGCSTPNPGIDENTLFGEGINIFPNPSTGMIRIGLKNPASGNLLIEVTDIFGRLIKSVTIKNPALQSELDLTDLSAGTYLLHFNQKDLNATKKLCLTLN